MYQKGERWTGGWRGWNLYSQLRLEVKRQNCGEEEVELKSISFTLNPMVFPIFHVSTTLGINKNILYQIFLNGLLCY